MKFIKIEKSFYIDGYKCVITGNHLGHRCGYVGIPEGHVLFDKDYDNIDVDVHGGLTYSNFRMDTPHFDATLWWIGFDCGHYDDGRDLELVRELGAPMEYEMVMELEKIYPTEGIVKTTAYVEHELYNLVQQIKDYKG